VVSTDTFTVDPLFFPGGDIGSLAVHGTVNDVAMLGARPTYLTCGFVLEEGLPLEDLEAAVRSMGRAAAEAGVRVVSGDTKVVPRGAVDKMFINTTGIGRLLLDRPLSGSSARPGDAIITSGTLGDHGLTIMASRAGLSFESNVRSDSAPLGGMVELLLERLGRVHVLRDPTRGGLATTLNEISSQSGVELLVREADLPVHPAVREGCSLLGLDPLYLANEGKLVCLVEAASAGEALKVLRSHPLGADARQIGEASAGEPGRVVLQTSIGGKRFLSMLEGEQLPRIC
jgi:hydrogenase expression/formation protein HypE